MDISKKIHELRLEQHKTLDEVARSVGVSKSTVSKWESGFIANMRRDKIAKLALELDTTPEYLLGWNDDTPALPASPDWNGSRLRRIREVTGESAETAALSMGIPLTHYLCYESGDSSPSFDDLKKMAYHFRYSIDALLGIEWPDAPVPGLKKDEVTLIELYRLAGTSDQIAINAILEKYKEKTARSKKQAG